MTRCLPMFRMEVTKETVSEYFRQVGVNFHEHAPDVLEEMGDILVGNITEFAPDWNPNLYLSGYEKDWWIIEPTDTGTILDIIYTGMLYEDTVGEDEMKGWFEFGGSSYPPSPPTRDYAYYQETGQDPIASPGGAKHKWFVAKGAKKSQKPIVNKAQVYLDDILQSAQKG